MGVFDNLKDAAEGLKEKAADLIDGHEEQVGQGLDKAGEFVDEKTGGKYGDQIDKGVGVAKDQVNNLNHEG
ncbi:antitoxin [Kribbella sp.]|uniref:antitoxin n=1 Tax=Kribbella sp. TaxID=1871183 RepID=UPI002D4B9A32|nr:antitoxin [Kribbella sp.]HZX06227.1 antitoxin [Kribbella sp.]